ncbi:MAG: DUF2339 domain-containing protein [Pseudomonadales bacterium]|nr:DUF2339 domain-containing protein [Pseudomonadales bacterium]
MNKEIQKLRKEVSVLEDTFDKKVRILSRRIDALEMKTIWQADDQADGAPAIDEQQENNKQTEPLVTSSYQPVTKSEKPAVKTMSYQRTQKPAAKTMSYQRTKKPSALTRMIKEGLLALVAPLLSPFFRSIEQFFNLYRHYRDQGKTPVFFMTSTGIIALVLGFGYLLQYSFNEFLGPPGKVALGFIVALITTVGGVLFTRQRKDMAEYGSGLIALGVILLYLCAYFAGPYYQLVPDLMGFIILATVTATAYVLSLLFVTRIVAIVTLVGGATLPLVMNHVDQSPQLYLSYLLILAIATLRLSQRIHWQPLALLCMGLCFAMIEISIGHATLDYQSVSLTQSLISIAIIHGFFYAFAHYALQGLSPTEGINRTRLIIVTSNIIFILFVTQNMILDSRTLGVLYLLNTLPWIAVFLLPKTLFNYSPLSDESRALQAIALLHAGLFMGVGILVLSSPEMRGIIWCLEGLMLIYLGSKFQLTSVRIEGYIALLFSLLAVGLQVTQWVINSIVPTAELLALNLGTGWGNLIAITCLTYFAVLLMERNRETLTATEMRLTVFLENLLSVLLSASFLLSVGILWPLGMWLLAIVPLFFLIWRAREKELFWTEVLGLGHYGLLAIPLIVSAVKTGNFHFSEQSIYGQVARVEAFLSLWLIAEFYQRFYRHSTRSGLTENMRLLFYCLIPVFFLPSVLRQHSDYLPVVLWGSSTIALFLYHRFQEPVLKLEMRLLIVAASATAIYSCWLAEFDDWQGNALSALLAGMVFFLIVGWLGQGLRRVPIGKYALASCHKALQPIYSWGIYYYAAAVFIITYGATSNESAALLATLIYFTGLFYYRPVLAPLRTNLILVYGSIFTLFFLMTMNSVWMVFQNSDQISRALLTILLNGSAIFCAALTVHRNSTQARAVWMRTRGNLVSLWAFNLISIPAYIAILTQLFSTMLGPIISFSLVVHATIILFQTTKPKMKKLIWLSVSTYIVSALKILFWDMNDFSLLQKIIVFMLIGACLLAAAYQYQKLMQRSGQTEEGNRSMSL